MLRKSLFTAIAAALVALLSPSDAHAWGARHVGYTHVGPNGVTHYGHTAGVGPYGAYSGSHVSHYGAGGDYRAGGGYGERYGAGYGGYHYGTGYGAYGAGYGGAYHYGTVQTGGYGYGPGVYRAW
ncbi:MAG: hypothetical protein K8U57_33635 [Planctomycetes bacterium]|nr:hypothetical protein [Planctomycetota bacterium]